MKDELLKVGHFLASIVQSNGNKIYIRTIVEVGDRKTVYDPTVWLQSIYSKCWA